MSIKYTVDTKDVDALQQSVDKGNRSICSAFDSIENTYNKINGYWESDAWEKIFESYSGQRDKISNVKSQMNVYPSVLEAASGNYRNSESENKNRVTSLSGNVIK